MCKESMRSNLSSSSVLVRLAALALAAATGFPLLGRANLMGTSGDAPPNTVMVAIRNYAFDPPSVTVHVGDTVEWKNDDSVDHTVTDEGNAQKRAFDSGHIQEGKTWSYVAGKKGMYKYDCTIHPFMKGTLIVE